MIPITVRVIEYALPGLPEGEPRYRLMTSLLDPTQAPALELAALYHEINENILSEQYLVAFLL